VLWIPSWWKWNPPDNSNAFVGALSDLAEVPQTQLLKEFASHDRHLPPKCQELLRERILNRIGDGIGDGTPYQEQDQEQEVQSTRIVSSSAVLSSSKSRTDRSTVQRETPNGFERFWACYPRKVGKGAALDEWRKLKPDAALSEMIAAAVEAQKVAPQWQKDGGQFVPHPRTWLHQRRWEDQPDLPTQEQLLVSPQTRQNLAAGKLALEIVAAQRRKGITDGDE
jgi:hypothetical protein